jgi:hypothetical protein
MSYSPYALGMWLYGHFAAGAQGLEVLLVGLAHGLSPQVTRELVGLKPHFAQLFVLQEPDSFNERICFI